MTPKWGFGVAMLPVGALCFYQAHFGRTVLPKWPFWAHLFHSVFYSVSEFLVLPGYFLGVPEFRAGEYLFGIFRGNSSSVC